MRVDVIPDDRPDLTLTLLDDSSVNQHAEAIRMFAHLDRHPLDGWYDSADIKTKAEDNPADNGLFMPNRLLLAERIVTIKAHRTRNPYQQGSSIDDNLFKDRLRALVGQPVTLRVEDSTGIRETTGWVSSKITAGDEDESYGMLRFALIITCPDPYQYAPPITYQLQPGINQVENNGTADTYPVLTVSGNPQQVTVTLTDRRVSWTFPDKPIQSTQLDLHTMIPPIGTLSTDDCFSLPPGVSTITLTVSGDAIVRLLVRNAWK